MANRPFSSSSTGTAWKALPQKIFLRWRRLWSRGRCCVLRRDLEPSQLRGEADFLVLRRQLQQFMGEPEQQDVGLETGRSLLHGAGLRGRLALRLQVSQVLDSVKHVLAGPLRARGVGIAVVGVL